MTDLGRGARCILTGDPDASHGENAIITGLLNQRRIDLPRDISVVRFDDTPIVKFSTPPVTAIRQLPFELIVRGSTAPPRRA